MSLFERKMIDGQEMVPVWFMRQAGRYHQHYQHLRAKHSFYDLCKIPELAAEVTMGPINDFKFDAAILFSDLLFPLENLNLGLSYESGGPTLSSRLEKLDQVKKLSLSLPSSIFYKFQEDATSLLRARLPLDKNLIGFVGGPFTLFAYAVHGSHAGSLQGAKAGLYDGRFETFCQILIPDILEEMASQANGGADTVAIFDTAVGELSLYDFKKFIVPLLHSICKQFKSRFPDRKIIYYSKHTTLNHLGAIENEYIDVLGVDYRHQLPEVFESLSADYYIQGNFDPCWLHLSPQDLQARLEDYLMLMKPLNKRWDRWIAGLGHGVLPATPENNVRRAVDFFHQHLRY